MSDTNAVGADTYTPITGDQLRSRGFDGLVQSGECGCLNEHLRECGFTPQDEYEDCVPAYAVPCGSSATGCNDEQGYRDCRGIYCMVESRPDANLWVERCDSLTEALAAAEERAQVAEAERDFERRVAAELAERLTYAGWCRPDGQRSTAPCQEDGDTCSECAYDAAREAAERSE